MSVCSAGMKWLEVLEKEFDSAFVNLDLILNQIDDEQADLVCDARNKTTSLSASFAQLIHKAIVLAENNDKLEVSFGNLPIDF